MLAGERTQLRRMKAIYLSLPYPAYAFSFRVRDVCVGSACRTTFPASYFCPWNPARRLFLSLFVALPGREGSGGGLESTWLRMPVHHLVPAMHSPASTDVPRADVTLCPTSIHALFVAAFLSGFRLLPCFR